MSDYKAHPPIDSNPDLQALYEKHHAAVIGGVVWKKREIAEELAWRDYQIMRAGSETRALTYREQDRLTKSLKLSIQRAAAAYAAIEEACPNSHLTETISELNDLLETVSRGVKVAAT